MKNITGLDNIDYTNLYNIKLFWKNTIIILKYCRYVGSYVGICGC